MKRLIEKFRYPIIAMIPTMLIGALLGAYPGYKLYKFVWVESAFCTSCHVHDYATMGWENSSHQKLTTCHDCHHQSLRAYMRDAVVMLIHQPQFPKDLDHIPYVKQEICEACHVSNPKDITTISGPITTEQLNRLPKIDKTYLHKLHMDKQTDLVLLHTQKIDLQNRMGNTAIMPNQKRAKMRDINCSDCHGGPANRAHNFKAVNVSCIRCHGEAHDSNFTKYYGCRNCHFQEFMIPLEEHKSKQTGDVTK